MPSFLSPFVMIALSKLYEDPELGYFVVPDISKGFFMEEPTSPLAGRPRLQKVANRGLERMRHADYVASQYQVDWPGFSRPHGCLPYVSLIYAPLSSTSEPPSLDSVMLQVLILSALYNGFTGCKNKELKCTFVDELGYSSLS
jgi:hypothetical protein